jgi:hypothetical protein
MFVENYRSENSESIMAGGDACPVPYPRLSQEDWRAWKYFLPVRWHEFDKMAAANADLNHLYLGIPADAAGEIQRASQYFDSVEVWRKYDVAKDPIAVGVLGDSRYLIARWGVERLIPFEAMKKSRLLAIAWKYALSGLCALASIAGVAILLLRGIS